ncbi:hypothetical protein [Streptomyces sp. NPDC006739]|uniref:hypothetical protein n=1 Tax=Streptomyces sp. NPDC006739 TaxID=3364763 RepID=UPI00367C69E0
MKKVVVGVVAAGVFLAGVGTALASAWRPLPDLLTTGAYFQHGNYQFNPPERNHGSIEWNGFLTDGDPNDGHNGYMEVRVEGHDWVRYYGKQGKRVYLHHSNWDGAQRYTDNAYLRTCRDKGAIHPDNCTSTYQLHRR